MEKENVFHIFYEIFHFYLLYLQNYFIPLSNFPKKFNYPINFIWRFIFISQLIDFLHN